MRIKRPSLASRFLILSAVVLSFAFFSSAASKLRFDLLNETISSSFQQTQSDKPRPPGKLTPEQREEQRQNILSHFQTVEYDLAEPTDTTERSKRQKKDKHYDRVGLVNKNPSDSGWSTVRVNEWSVDVPPLPSLKSDAVLIVEIKRGEAHLSTDKTGVYSEFAAKVREILKDTTSQLRLGHLIDVTRIGGVVHYPNGHKELYVIAEQYMPIIGGTYLLFLKTLEEAEDYEIITGYQLEGGKVTPLDGSDQFQVYLQVDQTIFLNAVHQSITQRERP